MIPETIFGAPRPWFLPAISKEPDTEGDYDEMRMRGWEDYTYE
jgi:hypothetical protein